MNAGSGSSPLPLVGRGGGGRGMRHSRAPWSTAVADITIASDAATFQVPEMLHNILPTMVMSALADRATRKALAYLVYSTKPVSAERALSYGIVSDVVPREVLEAEVE